MFLCRKVSWLLEEGGCELSLLFAGADVVVDVVVAAAAADSDDAH